MSMVTHSVCVVRWHTSDKTDLTRVRRPEVLGEGEGKAKPSF